MITGLNSSTPQNLLLDAGAFFKNYVVGTDTPETASTKCLGATQGGGSFNAVPSVRTIEVDGGKGNVKDLMAIDSWEVTMVANVKEMTKANIQLALGAVSAGTSTDTNYDLVEGKTDFGDDDYATNITWIGKIKGKTYPLIIQILNPISQNGLNLTVEDNNEATVAITLTGTYSLTDLDTPPFKIYYPKN